MKKLIAVLVVLGSVAAFGAAAKGNCQAKAVELKSSQTVKLVNEWDSEIGFFDLGTYYYKVRLTKGYSYSIWMTGGNAANMDINIYTDPWDDNAPVASFMPESFQNGAILAEYLYADEWSEDDPNTGLFYIQVSGEIGDTANLYFSSGIQNFVREGEEGNPKRITFTDTAQTQSATLLENGEYYFIASLEAGRKYRFRLNSGTAATPLSLDVSGADYWIEADPSAPHAPIRLIYPGETADYIFAIVNTNDTDVLAGGQSFNIAYYAYSTRLPADHDNVHPLEAASGYSVDVQPGREVADADRYYDAVIDESLCSIRVKAGERWVFQTEGAAMPLMMRAYDASGKTLNENRGMGNASLETRTAVAASYDGLYYVGVCDPSLDVVNLPTSGDVRVFAKRAEDFNGPNDYDAFDPTDDTQTGATLLVAYPGSASAFVTKVAKPNGPHVLSGGDWYDWYMLPGRKGVTYALKAAFSSLDTTDVLLNATVYKQTASARPRISTVGSIRPDLTDSNTAPLTFVADEDAMYYVCVYAGTGGHDYPAHDIYAMAYYEGVDMGLFTVTTKGVDGTWSLSPSGFQYPSGVTVVTPAGRNFSVYFPEVAGFKAEKDSISLSVEQYIAGDSEEIATVEGVYTDKFDPTDDVYTGFAKIAPAQATGKAPRTLWTNDVADHFCFKAQEGLYYNFALVDRSTGSAGDAAFSIHHVTGTSLDEPLVVNQTAYMKKRFDAGTYILKVAHENAADPLDTAYTLAYNCVNVGTVQFSAKSYSVSEKSEYVDVMVTRTSNQGALRLNFATEAYTAKPGSEYYPTNGVLSWANGDAEAKVIRIRLIPDLREKWDATLYFGVNIWPMAEDSWADGEYGAVISGPSKVAVKLAESSAKAPGTITVKAAPRAMAGDLLSVTLTRTGGSDGSVGVVVATVAGTAKRGTDFDSVQTNLVWEAGDTSDRTFTVQTHAVGSQAEKTLTLKIGSLKAVFPAQYGNLDDPASISSANTTATITSEVVGRTLEDLMTEPSYAGIRAEVLAGDLYVDASGALRTSAVPADGRAVFRFGVTGPGLFVMEPRLEDVALGDEPDFKFQVSGGAVRDCWSGDRIVVAVPSGSRNVSFVARSASGTAYASLQPLETGLPFKWIPFSSVVSVDPPNGAVVDASLERVSWTEPVGRTGEEIWYRVRASAKGTDPSTFTAEFTNMTTDTSCAVPAGLLRAGRQFWWRVDYAYVGTSKPEPEESDWMEGPSVWTFKTLAAGAPATVPSDFAVDANGRLVKDLIAKGEPVELVQGTRVDFSIAVSGGGAVSSAAVASGSLPPGTKLTAAGRLYGVPREAGDFRALVQANGGTTLTLDFHVAPIGSAAGSFCAVLREDGTAAAAFSRIGALSFSATEAGALSAKAKVGGAMHAFASSGYEAVLDRDDDALGQTMQLSATMYEVVTVGGIPCSNILEVTVGNGSVTNLVALGQLSGRARLTLNVDDGGVPREVAYTCELVRRNADSSAFVDAMSAFSGYYTASIVPHGAMASAGLPCGNGPMAFTVSADGAVKVSGVLPDGISFSSSAYCALRGDLSDVSDMRLIVPIVSVTSPNAFGGLLEIRHGEVDVDGETVPASYVDSYAELEWNKSGGMFDGSDFSLSANPVGGWYDTVVNLQRYYLNRDFSVEAEPVVGIPAGMLPSGYTYTVDTVPHGVEAMLAGDVLKVAERKIVKDGSRVDFGSSVNAWNVTLNFARGSGLVRGTATVVSDGDKQVMLGTVNHCGVLLMNRDARAPLDEDVWTAGFFLFPAGNGWKHSLPFNIRSTTVDRDWSEVELPDSE